MNMNMNMKKQLIFILLITSLTCFAENEPFNSVFDGYVEDQEISKDMLYLGAIGSGFNYQGELIDAGSAANTNHDFAFILYDALTAGNQVGSKVLKYNRPVNNGLFSIEDIDFGDAAYDGEELWMSVTVRETGNANSETLLSPRQKIGAVPYAVQADYLGPNGATDGDFLQFDGNDWKPKDNLYVRGDVKQPITSSGVMKYMVYAECGGGSSIIRRYNGVNLRQMSATGGNTGRCIIHFPADIDDRFWQVSIAYATSTVSIPRTANCRLESGSTDKLFCNVISPDNDTFVNGNIMVLVY